MSPAHQRSGEVWQLSIVGLALEPDSQVIQPRGRAGKDTQTRGLLLYMALSHIRPTPPLPAAEMYSIPSNAQCHALLCLSSFG